MIYGPGLQYVHELCPAFSNLVRDIKASMDEITQYSDKQYMAALQQDCDRVFRANVQVCLCSPPSPVITAAAVALF